MTSVERVLRTLNFEKTDRIPVIPQNNDMAINEAGMSFKEASYDGSLIAEALAAAIRKYDIDGVIVGPDACILAEAAGCVLEYTDNNPPAIMETAISSPEDFFLLKELDMEKDGRMKEWLKAVRILRKAFPDRFIACRADQGAVSLASEILGAERFLIALTDENQQKSVRALLDYCQRQHVRFARAVHDAGAQMTTCGDAYGGSEILGPDYFKEFTLTYERRASEVIIDHIGIPYTIHICGKTDAIHDIWCETRPSVFEIDHKTDIRSLRSKALPAKITLLGNLDTTLLAQGSPEEVTADCRELFSVMDNKSGFILSSGCSMGGNTKPENLTAMIEAAKEYGRFR